MNEYEKLLQKGADANVQICENYNFRYTRIKGLYCDGSVALSKDLDSREKTAVLAEELGHHYTSSGNILDQHSAENRKQEYRARLWAYNDRIGLKGIINATLAGCRSLEDMADYFSVSENFVADALNTYKEKYSPYTVVDNYLITFEPLGVLELYK